MSRVESNQPLMPSILDRLTDPDSMGSSGRPGYNIKQMIDSVRADLEELLNTRQSNPGLGKQFVEVRKSIVTYGLPDLTTIEASSKSAREAIGRAIERLITRFEPRLRQVRVTLVASPGNERRVRFHIEAHLCVDPSPEVGFETVLELTTGQTSVQASTA